MVKSFNSTRLLQQERIDLEHLDILFSSLGEGIIVIDAGGAVLAINPVAVKILGHQKMPGQPQEWSGQFKTCYSDGITPLPMEQIPLWRALQGEVVHDCHLVIYTPAGFKRHLLVTAAPLKDSQGQLFGAVAAFRDLSDLIEAQQALVVAHERLQAILRGISDGFITVNRNWLISSINPAAQALLGTFDEALLGAVELWSVLSLSSEDQDILQDCLSRAFDEQVLVEVVTYVPGRDLRCLIAAYPHGEELALFIHDETEAWRHKQLLMLEKEVLTLALDEQESLKLIVAEILIRFETVFSGRQSDLIWLNSDSIPFSGTARYVWTEQMKHIALAQWEAIVPGDDAVYTFESDVPVSFQAGQTAAFLPIRDPKGELEAIFVIVYPEPIWLLRQAEQRFIQRWALMLRTLIENKRQAARILVQRQRLLDVAWQQSHEFRRPLANILGLAELLKTEYGENAYLQLLMKEAETMDQIVHRIVRQSELIWEDELLNAEQSENQNPKA